MDTPPKPARTGKRTRPDGKRYTDQQWFFARYVAQGDKPLVALEKAYPSEFKGQVLRHQLNWKARKMMRVPVIQELIHEEMMALAAEAGVSPAKSVSRLMDLQARMFSIMNSAKASNSEVIRATAEHRKCEIEIGKLCGNYVERHFVITGDLTQDQAQRKLLELIEQHGWLREALKKGGVELPALPSAVVSTQYAPPLQPPPAAPT